MSDEIPSRAKAVRSAISQVTQQLQTLDAALAGCIGDLAIDPSNAALREERVRTAAEAARLRVELGDLHRAHQIAMQSDIGAERQALIARCEADAIKVKAMAQQRIKMVKELSTLVDAFVSKKLEYDRLDSQCHAVYYQVLRPIVDRDRFLQNPGMVNGRAPIPLFDQIASAIVLAEHQSPPLDQVRWKADSMADIMDRELLAVQQPQQPQEEVSDV